MPYLRRRIRHRHVAEVVLTYGFDGPGVYRVLVLSPAIFCDFTMSHTDSGDEAYQANAGQCILDEIWLSGSIEGGGGAVVLVVVRALGYPNNMSV